MLVEHVKHLHRRPVHHSVTTLDLEVPPKRYMLWILSRWRDVAIVVVFSSFRSNTRTAFLVLRRLEFLSRCFCQITARTFPVSFSPVSVFRQRFNNTKTSSHYGDVRRQVTRLLTHDCFSYQGLLNLLRKLRSTPQDELRILLLGLDNAGKVRSPQRAARGYRRLCRQHY